MHYGIQPGDVLYVETTDAERAVRDVLAWLAAALLLFLVFAHTVALQRIVLGLLVLAFIAHCIQTATWRPPLWRPIAAWLALAAASLAWSVEPRITADELLDEALYPLFVFALFHRIGSSARHDRRIVMAVLLGIALLALLSIGGYHRLVTDEGRSGWFRNYPGVGQVSTHAALAIPLFFLAWRSTSRPISRAGVLGLIGCFGIGAASLNRMFWPAAVAAVLVSCLGLGLRWKIRYVVTCGVVAAGLALVLVTLVQQARMTPPGPAPANASTTLDVEAMMDSEVRPKLWRTWFKVALERPWLGLGFGQEIPRHYHRPRAPKDPVLSDPYAGHHGHNLILNTLLQTGVVGVVVLLWLLGALTAAYLRQRGNRPAAAWAGVALVSAMLLKNTTDDFMRDAVAMYFWALAGWLLAVAERPQRVLGGGPQPLSVVIIARNEAQRIRACLESVKALADEIVVLDSGSTDGTQTLVRTLGARVIETDWPGFGAQKNRALHAAAHDWVLSLDADERVTPELADSIRSALASPAAAGYRFRRCNRFLGRDLRHGEGYPDWSLRLVDRSRARWSESAVHERIEVFGPVAELEGDLMHDSAESLEAYIAKQNAYSSLAAAEALRQGKRATVLHLALSPLVRFVRFYFMRRGFLDGVPGLVHIAIGCFASFMKYAKMYEQRAGALQPTRETPSAAPRQDEA